ncbi:hypothetical protein ACH5RR_020075 [Cinchona calisaya]|uniref:rRNA-processing protein FYV7 n=1 Tax=Cinchona calisaya TaxID=153742 RepID=A0ABD2ZDE8_9GENT
MKKNPGPGGSSNDEDVRENTDHHKFKGQYSKKKKKNMKRLGGRGLSLQAFANAKSRTNDYNPSLVKKQREFYKNAKYVSKYKRSLRQQEQQAGGNVATRQWEDSGETEEASKVNHKNKKNKKNRAHSLRELYENKREEEEKARVEMEASIQAKKEERQKSDAQRKSLKEKMFKKTKSGQPVMKYRIEHLLQTIQGSTS